MPSPNHPSIETLLACVTCGTQQRFDLHFQQLGELVRNGQVRLHCATCQTVTAWYGLAPDRRTGDDRRISRHARVGLPIRVRCNSADLAFTEVTTTITASRHGASFISARELREGMVVQVILPYSEGDPESLEKRARVVRAEAKGGANEIGVQILP